MSISATSDGLRRECEDACRDGFIGKMAIHPAQVPIINEVFTPSADALAHAQAIVDAFAANPGAGVVGIGGVMYDRPHLVARQAIAGALRSPSCPAIAGKGDHPKLAERARMVEGARASTIFLRRKRSSTSDAPSTTLRLLRKLRVVPLPRYRGGG